GGGIVEPEQDGWLADGGSLAVPMLQSRSAMRKGIILAGGAGTRLYPLTLAVSKQLVPVYNKPMIYYPLSTLMLAGIRGILAIQTRPAVWRGPLSARGGVRGGEPVALVLGDNLFYGHGLPEALRAAAERPAG